MFKYLIIFLALPNVLSAQKMYLVPDIGIHFSGLTYFSKGSNKPADLTSPVPKLAPIVGFQICYPAKHFTHRIGFQWAQSGVSFSFRNKFSSDTSLGFRKQTVSASVSNYIINYSILKEFKKIHLFVGRSTMRYYAAIGGGGAGKGSEYWKFFNIRTEAYGQYWGSFTREFDVGPSLFATADAGIHFYNKKKKKIVSLNVFYYKGITQTKKFEVNYYYGYFNDPNRQVSENVTLRTRGTVFGFNLGVPITIIKK